MTDENMTNEERAAELLRCEAELEDVWLSYYETMIRIHDQKLYLARAETWRDYLASLNKITYTSWTTNVKAAREALKLREQGLDFTNAYAAREWRRIMGQVDAAVRDLILSKARALAHPDAAISAGVLNRAATAVCDTLREATVTGGYVSVGDGQIAMSAAIDEQIAEAIARQRQYAIHGSKNAGWSKPVYVDLRHDFAQDQMLPDILRKLGVELPDGDAEIRISVREKGKA